MKLEVSCVYAIYEIKSIGTKNRIRTMQGTLEQGFRRIFWRISRNVVIWRISRNVPEDFVKCSRRFTSSESNIGLIWYSVAFTFGSSNISLLCALWYSAVLLSTLESWVLPGKPAAISMNWKLYLTILVY